MRPPLRALETRPIASGLTSTYTIGMNRHPRRDLAYEDPNGSQGALRISPFVFSPFGRENRSMPSKDNGGAGCTKKANGPASDLPNLAFEVNLTPFLIDDALPVVVTLAQ